MPGSTSRPLAAKGGDGTSHLGNMATIGQDWSSILLDVACQLILGPMYEHSNYGLCPSCDRCESDLKVFGTCSTEGSSSRQLAARKGRVDVVETPGCQVVMIYIYKADVQHACFFVSRNYLTSAKKELFLYASHEK